MKRTQVIAGLTALSLIATAGAAVAFGKDRAMHGQGGPRGPMFQFEEVDANADGKVTAEEIQAYEKARFDAADTNGDGSLSAEEMQASMAKRAEERAAQRQKMMTERMMKRMDANKDGVLSFDEMPGQQTHTEQMFARVDADGDGAVTKEEMDAAKAKMQERRGGKDGHRMGDRGGDRDGRGHGHGDKMRKGDCNR